MKKMIFVFLSIVAVATNSNGQKIDTIKTINDGTIPPAYYSNKLFYEKNYDTLKHINFEGLKYNTCYLGTITYYWPNGKVKTTTNYLIDTTGGLQKLPMSGHCNITDGESKTYTEAGKLIFTIVFDKGKMIKRY